MIRKISSIIPYLVLALMLVVQVSDPQPLQRLRGLVFDTYQRAEPRTFDPRLPVKIVDIDDASLAKLGQWPWPRPVLADMVTRLAQSGAAAIAFDIVFAERDRTSPEQILQLWPATPEVAAMRDNIATLPAHDALFANALRRAPVVIGFILKKDGKGRSPAVKTSFAIAGDDPKQFAPSFDAAIVNLEEIEAAATGYGAVNSLPDADQIIRRVPVIFEMGGQLYPSLAAEALRVAQRASTNVIKSSGASGEKSFGEKTGVVALRIGALSLPTDASGRVVVHFTKHEPKRYISAADVFSADFDPKRVAGQIVFVGTSAPGLSDLRATPLDTAMPGVEIHAQVVEQILSQHFLHRPDYSNAAEAVYVLVLGLLLIWLLPKIGAIWNMMLGGIATAIVVAGSWFGFNQAGWLIDPVAPSLMVLLVFLSSTVLSYIRSELARNQVRGAFSRYLSPVVVERLADHPEQLELGGELKTMTVMFADIRGFTALSERLKDDPQQLTTVINRFLTPMTEVVLANNGTIDKYIGDCLMAFWNAPLEDPDHAGNACKSALEMLAAVDALNLQMASEQQEEGVADIGQLESRYESAKALMLGTPTEADLKRAAEMFADVAEQGLAVAQYDLAKAYRDGSGVEQDLEMAAAWFERSAEQGYARAQRHIGRAYANALGVEQNKTLAIMWLSLAAGEGLVGAAEQLEAMLPDATDQEKDDGERMARDWSPNPEIRGSLQIKIGVGVSTGQCVVGNMGSNQRFDYSVLGDPVNLAARLEGQTKTYGVGNVIGEAAQGLAPDMAVLEIDSIAVKGRRQAVKIYTLRGGPELKSDPVFRKLEEQHNRLLVHYRAQDWETARETLEACTQLAPDLDELYGLYRDRIGFFEQNPPGPDWDGVYVAQEK